MFPQGFTFPVCEMGPQSLSASQAEAATANCSGGHLSREYMWGYRLPCRIFATALSALPHPLPRGTPHRLGATGTPQPWQTWTTMPVRLPRLAAPARYSYGARLAHAPARAHRLHDGSKRRWKMPARVRTEAFTERLCARRA